LAGVLETAIHEKRYFYEVIDTVAESVGRLPWAPISARRVAPMFFYQAAVLHYMNGNLEKAVKRTKDWLNTRDATDRADRKKALAQLEALNRLISSR